MICEKQCSLNFSQALKKKPSEKKKVISLSAESEDQEVLLSRGRSFWIGWLKVKYGMDHYQNHIKQLDQ
ncbi:hypothetical protein NX722_23590 [Endozoicomonas gorgoniicola]|uniref:Uncharacterized protein n=1 Tax=Endozoicomonas gorgoniicola TaxID=1234144 RepID=A0ABT3N1P5_9GAMM|nr:hypothetical protein [Endozoicomonas gorgoniicola]MCW7555551.1 hypothetical protein [Endozoicomonas gorgoniicola]